MSVTGNEEIFTTWISDVDAADASLVCLCGELDVSSAPAFLADVQKIINRPKDVIMDVHLLSYVDSTGAGAILSFNNALREAGKHLYLAGCHGILAKILDTIYAGDDLICCDDVDQAIAAVKSAEAAPGS